METSYESKVECGNMCQRLLTVDVPGGESTKIHIQIIDLGAQIYVWIASGGGSLSNISLAIKTRMDPQPSVASVLPSPATSQSASLAQRIGGYKGSTRQFDDPCLNCTAR